MEKVTKRSLEIIPKPHAHLQTLEKTCANRKEGDTIT